MDTERPDFEQIADNEKPKKPEGTTRRTWLGRGLKVGAGAALGALGVKEFTDSQIEQRSQDVAEMGKFLRGQDKGRIEIAGRKFNYEQFVDLLADLIKPKRESKKTIQALLDSFTYMMEVEDKFGGKFNTLRVLETIDRYTEPRLDVASSFGFGQINAQSARGIALEKADHLIKQGLLSSGQFEKLKSKNISEHEIVDMLDLSGNGNIPISFLYFVEGYDQYARTTRGRVHGVPENIRARGTLNADRRVDPRAFGLAVSAYSAKRESPMVAKAQTYVNEMMLADPDMKALLESIGLLDTDGDLGPNTLKALTLVSKKLGIRPPATAEQLKDPNFDRLQAMDAWLAVARTEWNQRLTQLLEDKTRDPKITREVISHRYHGVVSVYNLLKDMIPEKEQRIHELFLQFADKRDPGFIDLIDNPQKFEVEFGPGGYEKFLARVNTALPNIVRFDERYRGYIPMGYAAPSRSFADPKNIMMRVLLAHESDTGSRINIPLD